MYDRSGIMKKAHGYRRQFGIGMGEALRMAWGRAKYLAACRKSGEFLHQMKDYHTNADVEAHLYGSVA